MKDFFLRFHTNDPLPAFPRVLCVGKETRHSPATRPPGPIRPGRPHVIFQYTLAGAGFFRQQERTWTVPPGTGILCLSRSVDIDFGYPTGAAHPWQFLFVNLSGGSALRMAGDLIRHFGHLYDLAPDCDSMRQLTAFQPFCNVGYTLPPGESARLAMGLLHALALSKLKAIDSHEDRVLADQFESAVRLELGAPIVIGRIAESLQVSPAHLARVYRRQTGMAPHEFIRNAKIVAACDLLLTNRCSIKEIAGRLGFTSPNVFVRAFKRVMGSTPSRFQQQRLFTPIPASPPEPTRTDNE